LPGCSENLKGEPLGQITGWITSATRHCLCEWHQQHGSGIIFKTQVPPILTKHRLSLGPLVFLLFPSLPFFFSIKLYYSTGDLLNQVSSVASEFAAS
jgi:hypothetical protein